MKKNKARQWRERGMGEERDILSLMKWFVREDSKEVRGQSCCYQSESVSKGPEAGDHLGFSR